MVRDYLCRLGGPPPKYLLISGSFFGGLRLIKSSGTFRSHSSSLPVVLTGDSGPFGQRRPQVLPPKKRLTSHQVPVVLTGLASFGSDQSGPPSGNRETFLIRSLPESRPELGPEASANLEKPCCFGPVHPGFCCGSPRTRVHGSRVLARVAVNGCNQSMSDTRDAVMAHVASSQES